MDRMAVISSWLPQSLETRTPLRVSDHPAQSLQVFAEPSASQSQVLEHDCPLFGTQPTFI